MESRMARLEVQVESIDKLLGEVREDVKCLLRLSNNFNGALVRLEEHEKRIRDVENWKIRVTVVAATVAATISLALNFISGL